jgi:hypothetical protein
MALKSFTAYKVECDHDGCDYIVEAGDVEFWTTDPGYAHDVWRDDGNWTDGKIYICDDHRFEPHTFVGSDDYCDRCQIDSDEHL